MWVRRLVLAASLVGSAASLAQSLPQPPPSYDNTVYLFVNTPNLLTSDAAFRPEADIILAKLHGGPYARVGASNFIIVDMPWTADLANPVLSSPTTAWLSAALSRAQTRGLAVQFGAIAGVSRAVSVYDAARREDRRNAQWYGDGTLQKPVGNEIFMTPSRYARKLRRHLETKVRAFARMLVDLRQQYPDTLVAASGDGEMELNYGGLDASVPFEDQMIADYSPFAIAEFRDWIRHAGLYGPGQPYDGQGLVSGGARYLGPDGLSNFAIDYGAGFTSWNLRYFDWDVTRDQVEGDTRAIPDTTYEGAGWTPLPSSGPDFVAGGFDAPRSGGGTPVAFWQLWLRFRETMVANYQKDFASWVTTTANAGGSTFEAKRWYSHQIPADYVGGTFPGCWNPDRRLRTSASPMSTANVAPSGSIGLTVFDVYGYDPSTQSVGYMRTSRFLFDDLKARSVQNWGLVEWNPSWPLGAPDPDALGIAVQAKRAYDAGAHILNYLLWDFFVGTQISQSLDQFLSQVMNQPRITQVSGLSGRWFSTTISLSWSDLVFPGVAGFHYADWTAFFRFETWRGASKTFGTTDGVKVGNPTIASQDGIVPDVSKPFYRVRAIARDGSAWAFSDSVSPPPPGGSGFYTLTPCRVLDTRGLGAPLGGPAVPASSRLTYTPTDICGIPAGAKAISANVTVVAPAARGFVRFVPGDTAATSASTLSFSPGRVRANNAILSLSETGTLSAENVSAAPINIVIDVNGYFQ